jgi:iron only hydrogenase large subunit-like protein
VTRKLLTENAPRAANVRDTDYVLTCKQLAAVLDSKGIDLLSLEDGENDDPLGLAAGAGTLFGTTGVLQPHCQCSTPLEASVVLNSSEWLVPAE